MSVLTIQPSDIDTWLYQYAKTTNYGAETKLYIRSYYADPDYANARSILKFDFSALPSGAIISAAVLSLYKYSGSTGRTYWAYELTQPGWVESEASWDHYKGTTHWAANGGDFTTVNGASQTSPGNNNWMDFVVLSLVQHFQSTHAEVAHFLIKDGTENENSDGFFYSSEYTIDPSLCPKLVITYSVVTHYTLTAVAGSYLKTGQNTGLKAARKIAALSSSYGLTGQPVALRAIRKIQAVLGAYSLTGQAATLRAIRKIIPAPGSYSLTGQPVALKLARKIPAGAGSYSLTGQDAVLRAIRKAAAEGGSYVYTGIDANLTLGQHYILTCEPGVYGEPYSKIFVTLDGRIYKKMGDTYLRLS